MLGADWDFIAADLPQTITFGSTSYTAIVTSVSVGRELQEVGLMPQIELTVYIKKASFATVPTTGNKITYSGSQYRIVGYDESNDGIQRILRCKELPG